MKIKVCYLGRPGEGGGPQLPGDAGACPLVVAGEVGPGRGWEVGPGFQGKLGPVPQIWL